MKRKCKYCNKLFFIHKRRKKYWWLYYKRKFCSNSCWRKYYRYVLKKDIYKSNILKTKKEIERERRRQREYYHLNIKRKRESQRKRYNPHKRKIRFKNLKLEVLSHYAPKNKIQCQCCGEKYVEFLTIDHIYGGGNKHLKKIKCTLYNWLKRNNYPKGFRILCMNCNFARRFNQKCPHQK